MNFGPKGYIEFNKVYYTRNGNLINFNEVCEMAGRNPKYVKEKARKLLLKRNGWNVDVPITSHYRQGPKRKRKPKYRKTLTGNSYYAAMGKKGGRPRIYNVV